MRILHICLSGNYIDGWGYQDNLLPQYLTLEGVKNVVVASANKFPAYLSPDKTEEIKMKGSRYEYEGVGIRRIKTFNPTSSLAFAPALYRSLCLEKPDVIFHHGVSFSTFPAVRRYARKHHVVVLVDNHADEINLSKSKLWVLLYHRIVNRLSCRRISPYVARFYGVSPARCDFLTAYYKIPSSRVFLLPIGADVCLAEKLPSKMVLREKYGFGQNDSIIVSGGKMGIDKGTDVLIKAVEESGRKLILFGQFSDQQTQVLANQSLYTFVYGWCNRQETLELLKLADVACWPVHHTTLYEDAVAVGTPLLVRKSGNASHLLNGNGLWTSTFSLKNDINAFFAMNQATLEVAAVKMRNQISYITVARQVLEDSILVK